MEKKHKVLMLIPQLGYGGAEKSFISLANYLSTYYDVTVALFDEYFRGYEVNTHDRLNESIKVQYLGSDGGQFKRWMKRWNNFRKLKKNADVSISFLSGANLLNSLCGTDTYTIVSERGSKKYDVLLTGWKRILWLKILDPYIYRSSDKITTVSEGLSDEILETGITGLEKKVIAIEGYINSQKLIDISEESMEEEFEVLRKYPTIVAVGRLSKEKGFQYLIKVFSNVKKMVPDAKLLLVGDGPESEYLKKLTEDEYGLKAGEDKQYYENYDVIFAGYRSKPSRYLKVGKVACFTSLIEGLPNVLIEILASGIPVLAADCSLGVRKVLNMSRDIDKDLLPHENNSGVLMPMINTDNGISLWSEYLVYHLNFPKKQSSFMARMESIEKFDLKNTGKSWLKIIDRSQSNNK